MKNYFLLSVLFIVSMSSQAQVIVGKVDVNLVDSIRIVEVYIDRPAARKVVSVALDYGQMDNSMFGTIGIRNDDFRIMDPKTNSKMVFKSTAAVINFMDRNNWDHYDTVAITSGSSAGFYYYFKKRLVK